jgi:hypothetical protein
MESVDLIVDELNRCGLHVNADLGASPGVGIENTIVFELNDVNLAGISNDNVSFEVDFILTWMQPYAVKVAKDIAKVCWAIEQSKGFEKPIKFGDTSVTAIAADIKDTAIPNGFVYLIEVYGSFMEDVDSKTFMDAQK